MDEKKKVLVIPGRFVPSNDTVTLLTYKHLRQLDYQFDVVALKSDTDNSILNNLEKDSNYKKLNIKYIGSYDDVIMNMNNKNVIKGIINMFKYTKECVKQFDSEKYDAIYSSSIPCFTHYAAYKIKKKNKDIKWISSFSDPIYKSPYKHDVETIKRYSIIEKIGFYVYIFVYMNSRFEKLAIKNADEIITISEEQKEFMCSNYKVNYRKKFNVVPLNYIETWDIYSDLIKSNGNLNNKKDKLIFVHMGRLYGLRKIENFLIALSKLDDIIKSKIEIHQYGEIQPRYINIIKELKLTEAFLIKDSIPYEDAMNKLIESDVLLIFDTIIEKGIQPYLPSKILEYQLTNKPIMAIANNNSPVYRLLKDNNFVSNEINEIIDGLTGIVNNYHHVDNYSDAVSNKDIEHIMKGIFNVK